MKMYFYKAVMGITFGFLSSACIAEPVFAIKATIYKLESKITIDSKIDETLKGRFLSPKTTGINSWCMPTIDINS